MFTADWCGPCKVFKPVFQAYEAKYPEVGFLMVDVDKLQVRLPYLQTILDRHPLPFLYSSDIS
jgi:thiol-disulfide isomerase/thioredoxin